MGHKIKIYEIHEKERKKLIVPISLSLPVSILKSCCSGISSCLYPLSLGSRSWSAQHSLGAPAATTPSTGAGRGLGAAVAPSSPRRLSLVPPAGAVRLLCLLGAARVAAQATSGEGQARAAAQATSGEQARAHRRDPSLPSSTRSSFNNGSVEPSFSLGQRAEVVASRRTTKAVASRFILDNPN